MTDTINDTVRRAQESYADDLQRGLQRGADSVQKFGAWLPTLDAKVLDEAVDHYFNVAEQVLVAQREFAKGVLAATTSVATNAASAAQGAAGNVKKS